MGNEKGLTRREIMGGAFGAAAASIGGLVGCTSNTFRNRPGPDAAANDALATHDGWLGGDRTSDVRLSDVRGTDSHVSNSQVVDTGPQTPVKGASTVVTIQNDDSLDRSRQPQIDVVQGMIDFLLSELAGGVANPWSQLLPNADSSTRIGLKVSCLPGGIPTSPVVVQAIVNNLVSKGNFLPAHIIVWERYLTDFQAAKYEFTNWRGAGLLGTCDGTQTNGDPIVGRGPGYGDPGEVIDGDQPGLRPALSRILTDLTDVTINCPVLKAHGESGFTAALKNCYGMFDIPGHYHRPYIQTCLPKLYAIPAIRNSIQLTIVDALAVSVTRDNISPRDRWPGRLFASRDPLALDYYALDLANELRAQRMPIASGPIHSELLQWMDNAYQLGIGAKQYRLVTLNANGEVVKTGGGGVDAGGDGA